MQGLCNWLAPRAERPSKSATARSNTFRPNLEALDRRDVPSVSSVLTNTFGDVQFIVDNTNTLKVSINGGTASPLSLGGPVRTAQGFRTADGTIGVDAVLTDGTWVHDQLGAPGILGSNMFTRTAAQIGALPTGSTILSVTEAYNAQGQLHLDILSTTNNSNTPTALGVTGSVFDFNQATGSVGTILGGATNVDWINTYVDAAGGTGIAFGQEIGNGEFRAQRMDTTTGGFVTLYDGADTITAKITGYSQSVLSSANTLQGILNPGSATTKVVIDITYNASTSFLPTNTTGTYALEFTAGVPNAAVAGVTGVGTDNSILPGG
jgi:hypothetical protein